MCGLCNYDSTYEALSDLREEISQLDANASDLTKEELVEAIDVIATRMWW